MVSPSVTDTTLPSHANRRDGNINKYSRIAKYSLSDLAIYCNFHAGFQLKIFSSFGFNSDFMMATAITRSRDNYA